MSNSGFPYSVGIAQSPVYNNNDIDPQMSIKDMEEQKSRADKVMPFPLDIHQSLGNIYLILSDIRSKLGQAESNPTISKEKLIQINDKLLDANQILLIEIPEILATLEM